jgi:hypothetical protein
MNSTLFIFRIRIRKKQMRPIIEDSFAKHSNKNHTSSEPPRMPTVQKLHFYLIA